MKTKSKAKPADPFWLTKTQTAALIGLSVRQSDDVIRPRLKKESIRGSGFTLRYFAPHVVAALVAYRVEKSMPLTDEAAMLAGADSPALERYRLVRAKSEELDYAVKKKEMINAGVFVEAVKAACSALRSTAERMARRFGNLAAEDYNEGVSEFERMMSDAVEKLTPVHESSDPGTDDDRGPRPPAPHSEGKKPRRVRRPGNRRAHRAHARKVQNKKTAGGTAAVQ